MLMTITTPVWATEDSEQDAAPDIELLEFLGEWEDPQGNWLDPVQFDQALGDDSEEQDND